MRSLPVPTWPNTLSISGYAASIKEVFDKYLSPGLPFYVPKTGVTPEDAVRAIRDGGGIAILAHPLLYGFTPSQLGHLHRTLKTLRTSGHRNLLQHLFPGG